MNLHTYAIRTMKEDGCLVEKRFQAIVETLETAYRCLEDLLIHCSWTRSMVSKN